MSWLYKLIPGKIRDDLRRKVVETINDSPLGDSLRKSSSGLELKESQLRDLSLHVENLTLLLTSTADNLKSLGVAVEGIHRELKQLREDHGEFTKKYDSLSFEDKFSKVENALKLNSERINYVASIVYSQMPELIEPDIETGEMGRDFFRRHGLPGDINMSISKNDVMFQYSVLHEKDSRKAFLGYLIIGLNGATIIQNAAKKYFNGLEHAGNILDFACGHGRITRFIVKLQDPKRVFVSDIKPDAVDFQKKIFGVGGFVSSGNPDQVNINERFDIIFSGSLFSHLPENLFYKWLDKLFSWLTPNGVLIFSVHDMRLWGGEKDQDFIFYPGNEDVIFPEVQGHLSDRSGYGISYVSSEFVINCIRRLGENVFYSFEEKEFGGLQDVYYVSRRKFPD